MADAGFFKGTSAEQDSRFANKQKKLLKQMKFPDNIDVKVDMAKISFDVIKPWITKRLQELLGIEDDVVIEFVFNQLEDKNPDPKMMQINLTGFLGGSKARLFISELWKLLASAQSSPDGIPVELVEMKKKELLKRQEEDDRLREIRKREEESHRQDIKSDIDKSENKQNTGRNVMSSTNNNNNKSRNENGNTGGYKSRASYENNRRDRRRSPPEKIRQPRESPETKARRPEKKARRSISKSSNHEDDRHHRQTKRSPIKSSRKPEKHQQRTSSSSSTASDTSHKITEKPSSNSNVDHSHKKTKKPAVSNTKSVPVKESVASKSKKNKKPSKRTRSSSTSISRSTSNSSVSRSASSSSSVVEVKKHKKTKRSPSPARNRKSDKKKDDHKSRKASKSSSRKHHRSNENKRKSHRVLRSLANGNRVNLDHLDKFKSKKNHRHESSKRKSSPSSDHEILPPPPSSSPPKKPRLESQIRMQTPPPSDDHKIEQQVVPIKSNRSKRIVVLEESRVDRLSSISTHVSIKGKNNIKDEPPKNTNSSEDENEIDLRERLLREKAIKSMRRRQLSTNNNDINTTKTTSDRIVYETQ